MELIKSFRSNETVRKTIIIIVAILLGAYVLVGFGSAPVNSLTQGDTVASIGSVDIKLQDVMIQLKDNEQRFGQAGKDVIDNATASQLVTSATMLDQAEKMGITVSDEELVDFVLAQRKKPDGTYLTDEEWKNILRNVYNVQVDSYEEFKRDELRARKLFQLFSSSAYVSEKDVSDRFAKDNQKVALELVTVTANDVRSEVTLTGDADYQNLMAKSPDAFKSGEQRKVKFITLSYEAYDDGVAPTDAEVKAEYEKNLERYKQRESVKANHILVKADKRSDAEALALAQKVKAEITAGLPFADAAKMYSEDESNKDRGGDLGTFSRGRMVKPFEDAVFAMQDKTISDPVKTDFGYHLIERIQYTPEQTTPLEQVKGNILNILTRDKRKSKALEVANEFHNLLGEKNTFEQAAEKINAKGGKQKIEIQTSPLFDSDATSDLGPALKSNPQVRRRAFELENLNDFSEPLALGMEVAVIQYLEKADPRPLTYETDTNRVKQIAQQIAGVEFLKSELAKIREEATAAPTKTLKEICASRPWIKENHLKTTTLVDATTMPYEIRHKDLDFSKDIYSLAVGQFVARNDTDDENRFHLTRVKERQEVDASKLEEQRYAIIERLRSEKAGDLFSAYLFAKRQELDPDGKAKVSIVAAMNRR